MYNNDDSQYRMSASDINQSDNAGQNTTANTSETSANTGYTNTTNNFGADTTNTYNQNYGTGTYNNNTVYGFNSATGQSTQGFNTYNQSNIKVEKPKKPRKPIKFTGKFLKKAACFVMIAILFGGIAGSVMYSVNYYANKYISDTSSSSTEKASIATVSTVSSVSSDSDTDLSSGSTTIDTESISEALLPAMVELNGTTTVTSSSSFGIGTQSYEATSAGTGIIIGQNDSEILVVTNAHVVDDIDNLTAVFVDGSSASATVKGSKSDQDIAVVAINISDLSSDTISAIAIAELDYTSEIKVGQQVVAIGNALGEGQSVTTGIISALDRSITVDNTEFTGLIMTNAAINSGNSGGALINSDGKVIAINFAKTSSDGVEGMAYAIPISNVVDLINSLMNKETRTKVSEDEAAYLGIAGVDITDYYASVYGYPTGVLIRTVQSDSAAEKAGLESYDIIVGFDDNTISSMSGLQSLLQYYSAGETVTIEYYHLEGSSYVLKTVDVTLGSKN